MRDNDLHGMDEQWIAEGKGVSGWPERLFVTSVVLVWGTYLLGLLALAVSILHS